MDRAFPHVSKLPNIDSAQVSAQWRALTCALGVAEGLPRTRKRRENAYWTSVSTETYIPQCLYQHCKGSSLLNSSRLASLRLCDLQRPWKNLVRIRQVAYWTVSSSSQL